MFRNLEQLQQHFSWSNHQCQAAVVAASGQVHGGDGDGSDDGGAELGPAAASPLLGPELPFLEP